MLYPLSYERAVSALTGFYQELLRGVETEGIKDPGPRDSNTNGRPVAAVG